MLSQLLFDKYFMAHGDCVDWDWFIVQGHTLSNIITTLEYWIIAFFCYKVSQWGRAKGHWNGLFNALMWVFIACSSNYITGSIVFYYPMYYEQTIISIIGTLVSFRAIYHIVKLGKTNLSAFLHGVKTTVQSANL